MGKWRNGQRENVKWNNDTRMIHELIIDLTLAQPKLKLMAFAWPMWRMPLGSGGNLVWTYIIYFTIHALLKTILKVKATLICTKLNITCL